MLEDLALSPCFKPFSRNDFASREAGGLLGCARRCRGSSPRQTTFAVLIAFAILWLGSGKVEKRLNVVLIGSP
jgi:hypothetical protein